VVAIGTILHLNSRFTLANEFIYILSDTLLTSIPNLIQLSRFQPEHQISEVNASKNAEAQVGQASFFLASISSSICTKAPVAPSTVANSVHTRFSGTPLINLPIMSFVPVRLHVE
jgi:hypothetical protein